MLSLFIIVSIMFPFVLIFLSFGGFSPFYTIFFPKTIFWASKQSFEPVKKRKDFSKELNRERKRLLLRNQAALSVKINNFFVKGK